jgi:hypothetical protein
MKNDKDGQMADGAGSTPLRRERGMLCGQKSNKSFQIKQI